MMKLNKKGDFLHESAIWIILNIVFFVGLVGFIYIQSSSNFLLAQKTSKQIALIIDASLPGTEIDMDISEEIFQADENNIVSPIKIDNEKNLVIVELEEDREYKYHFFNDVYVDVKIDVQNKLLKLKIL